MLFYTKGVLSQGKSESNSFGIVGSELMVRSFVFSVSTLLVSNVGRTFCSNIFRITGISVHWFLICW